MSGSCLPTQSLRIKASTGYLAVWGPIIFLNGPYCVGHGGLLVQSHVRIIKPLQHVHAHTHTFHRASVSLHIQPQAKRLASIPFLWNTSLDNGTFFFFLATINSILTQTTCGKGVRKNPEWGELESGLMFHSVVTKSQHGSALNYYTSHEYPRGKKTYRLWLESCTGVVEEGRKEEVWGR